jgi:ketosteroid isomerase-like protein
MGRSARKGLFIAGGALAAALAIVAALMLVTTRPAPTATDGDQVRRVLEGMNGSYNRSDFEAFASHVCADILRAGGYEAGWYQSRKSDGPTQITVNSVDVTGDGDNAQAVANVRFVAANHSDAKTLDVDFLREGDQWKACRYAAGQSL